MGLKTIECASFAHNTRVTFTFDDGITISGYIRNIANQWFVDLPGISNDHVYKRLFPNGYRNFTEFVKIVVGYTGPGTWPEVRSASDLNKVFNALLEISKVTTKDTTKVNKGNPIKVNKHKTVKLNFNL